VPVLRIEGVALLGSWIATAGGYAVMSLRRHRTLLLGNVAALVLTAALTLVLASGHGARGTALATALGAASLAVVYGVDLIAVDRRLHPSFDSALRLALAAGAACAVLLLGLPAGAQLALALAVYTAAVAVLRAFPRELLELLPRRSS
jgi:O-antigen/teichoic acid export membrane protein